MSLTSYRAAPPRGGVVLIMRGSGLVARRRPTLPCLEAQYHGRWGVSRPSSGWDRVCPPRDGHRATGPDPPLKGLPGSGCVCACVRACVRGVLRCRVRAPPARRLGAARLGAACGGGGGGGVPCGTPTDRGGDGGSELCRAIRTARLRGLPHFHLRPIDVLVWHGPRGDLVLRGVSRLDAFSGYPVRTWLPGGAAGATTGAPAVRPSRSSCTRGGSSQLSYTNRR